MTDPFESPKRTLAWAKHHINDFRIKVAEIASDKHWAYIVETNLDGRTEAHKIKLDRDLFGALACVAFDATNNLRSVLDQMAFQIARLHTGNDNPKSAAFPFAADAGKLAIKAKGVCKDLPPEIKALFIGFQPYKTGDKTLWAINEIANSAKHFALIPTRIDPTFIRLHVHVGGKSAAFTSLWDDAKYEMKIFDAPLGYERQDKVTMTIHVSFDHREPAIAHHLAPRLLDAMSGIIERILMATEAECRRIGLI
jgi:hypothetical protein